MIEPRFYREKMGKGRFRSFTIRYKDSDLWIGVDFNSFDDKMPAFAQQKLVSIRQELEAYIKKHPEFANTFSPFYLEDKAPDIAHRMASAGEIANTGPMAAVAGAFAEYIGKLIQSEFFIKEIIVENGGDIYLTVQHDTIISVYAGKSVLSEKIGVEIKAKDTPLGICTSAGKVGPSISFGKADAVMVACRDTLFADAFATAIGNCIQNSNDIDSVLQNFKNHPEIQFLLIVCDDKIGFQGKFSICPVKR